MSKNKIKGKDLKKINIKSDKVKSIAIGIMSRHYKHLSKVEKLELLSTVMNTPDEYIEDEYLGSFASEFIAKPELKTLSQIELKEENGEYNIYGKKHISLNAIRQMDVAMSLPIAEKGALMPDAHLGYGLPIGGVLAARDVVIPYGVGVDIACSMCLTVYALPKDYIKRYSYQIKTALKEYTHFGIQTVADFNIEHEVFDRPEFNELPLLKKLRGKAIRQIGSSGSGNHFVEFGTVKLDENNALNLDQGEYVGILSHSGSRGMGAEIANVYTRLAIEQCKLPKVAQHLAWFDINSAEGQEYWKCMNLAGHYAKANHEVIHNQLAKALKIKKATQIFNHHNFAWKEVFDGQEFIVHRKGATPAGKGVLSIIPGSMAAPAYIVSGKGDVMALNSASHGAGRKITRNKAKSTITKSDLKKMLKKKNVTLIGGGVDESPLVYKNIDEVMSCQQNLVNIEGVFNPKIVRMDHE